MIRSSSDDLTVQAEPFIQRLANSFEQRGLVGEHKAVTREDLIQVGRVATWRASQTFDPTRGVTFFTYAFPGIWRDIIAEVHKMGDAVRLPGGMHWNVIRHVAAAAEEMKSVYPTLSEMQEYEPLLKILRSIKDNTKIPELIEVAYIYLYSNKEISMDQMDEEENIEEFSNTPGNFDVKLRVEENELSGRVDEVLALVLSPREREILEYRLGFRDGNNWNLRDVSKAVDITVEGVRQIEKNALEKLRRDPRGRSLLQAWRT